MTYGEIESKVKDFVEKFRSGYYETDTTKFGHWVTEKYGVNPIYQELAYAISEFETSSKESPIYYEDLDNLNKMINQAFAHGIIKTTKTNQIEELNERLKNLETQLQDKNKEIELLIEEKGNLKGKIEMYERDLPKSDTLTGDVSD